MTAACSVSHGKRGNHYLKYALHILVLAGLTVAGLKYLQVDMFWRAFHLFEWAYAPVLLTLTMGYILVKGTRFTAMMRSLTATDEGVLMRAYIAGQACTLLPGGSAARAGILSQVGIPASATAAPLAISSLSDQLLFIFCAMVAAFWFEPARQPALIMLGVLLCIGILLRMDASRKWMMGLFERLMSRFRLLGHWREFLLSLREVATPRVILAGVFNAALASALMVAALALCAIGFEVRIPTFTLLLAYTLPAMLGRLSGMPGGVGVTEAGMIGILNSAPGVTMDQAAIVTLVFRLGTVVFAALFGGIVYAIAWRGDREDACN